MRERRRREKMGIPIDDETWRQIVGTAYQYGLKIPAPE
jgi:LDH2 family malate/lactate/ureidoglycolate dehydrogenase